MQSYAERGRLTCRETTAHVQGASLKAVVPQLLWFLAPGSAPAARKPALESEGDNPLVKFEVDPAHPGETLHDITQQLRMLADLMTQGEQGGLMLSDASLTGLYTLLAAMADGVDGVNAVVARLLMKQAA